MTDQCDLVCLSEFVRTRC